MSMFRRMPGWGWIVAGLVIAVLFTPTSVAAAKGALKFTGIEGTSTNRADVTGAGQVLTAPATPDDLFSPPSVNLSTTYQAVATPPSGSALVLEHLDVDVFGATASGGLVNFQLMPTGCNGYFLNPYELHANPPGATTGFFDVPLAPGLVVPSGDSLCAESSTATLQAAVNPTGELIPAGSA
jgi:hypothetical protein